MDASRCRSALVTLAALVALPAHAGGQPLPVTRANDVRAQNAVPAGAEQSYLHAERIGAGKYRVVITAPADDTLYLSNCNGQMMWFVALPEGGYPPNWEPRPVDLCEGPTSVVEAGQSRMFEVNLGRRPDDDSPPRKVHIVLPGMATTPHLGYPHPHTPIPPEKARSNLVTW